LASLPPEQWRQCEPEEDLDWSQPTLQGGALACCGPSLSFAVDNTHAFAYDNGPESPEASRYIEVRDITTVEPASHRGLMKHYHHSSEDREVIYERVVDRVVNWNLAHETLIPHEHNPKLKR